MTHESTATTDASPQTKDSARVYIYALVDPETGARRYVGKSIRPAERLNNHMNERSNCHRSHWLQSLKRRGLRPRLELLEAVAEGASWQDAERRWIAHGRASGWPLTNNTDGGDGVPGLPSETRARMRSVWLGRKHAPETIAKYRATRRGRRKFDAATRAEVERRLAAGTKVKDLAAEFDVHRTTISKIKKGQYP